MAMSKQTRSLVSTVVVAVVGAGVVWGGFYATKASNDETDTRTKADAKAFDFEGHQVHKVDLTAKGETVSAERVDGVWRLTSPVQSRADVTAVDEILSALSGLKAKDLNANTKPRKAPDFTLADASKAADFGLDEPSFIVKFTPTDSAPLELKVGDENPYDKSRPFLVSGNSHIRLAGGELATSLDKSLFDLRDKSVVPHESSDVFSLRVTTSKGSWAAERTSEGWKLTEPFADSADKEVVDGVLARLQSTQATAFVEESAPVDLVRYGLDSPAASVVFAIGVHKIEKTLEFGEVEQNGQKKVYARIREGGPVAVVDAALLKELSKDVNDLRDRTVAEFDRTQATKIEVTVGDEAFTLLATIGAVGELKFQLVGAENEKLKAWKATSALYTLSTLKGQSIVTETPGDLSQWGLDSPSATYVVSGGAGVELARVLIGKQIGDARYYAMKAGSTRVYEVEKSTVDSLPRSRAELLESTSQAASATPDLLDED